MISLAAAWTRGHAHAPNPAIFKRRAVTIAASRGENLNSTAVQSVAFINYCDETPQTPPTDDIKKPLSVFTRPRQHPRLYVLGLSVSLP